MRDSYREILTTIAYRGADLRRHARRSRSVASTPVVAAGAGAAASSFGPPSREEDANRRGLLLGDRIKCNF